MKFILDNWMLITIALSSGFFLLLPVMQGAAATGITPTEAVQCMNREKGVVVEYTSQRDKNGRKIYEGDVVIGPVGTSHGPASRHKDWLFYVRFDERSAGFYLHMDRRNSVYGPGSTYRAIPSWEECEVIGNIFENSELLK